MPSMCQVLDSVPSTADHRHSQIAKTVFVFGGVHECIRRCVVSGAVSRSGDGVAKSVEI